MQLQLKKIILAITAFLFYLQLFAQIPTGYYDNTEGLSGEELKAILNQIIKDHTEFPYTSEDTDVWDILKETDRDPENPDNVILLYTGWSVNAEQEYNSGSGWSREHVWAKSHGDFGTDPPAGTDAHNLRPCDVSVNSARGNKDFDNGGTQHSEAVECYTDSDSWEPRDAVKGDVARMMFYMATRYEGYNGDPDLELVDYTGTTGPFFGKLSTLLQWNKEDLVDDFERNRNEVIYSYQGNRNPFIDHPEFADYIWDTTQNVSAPDEDNTKNISVFPNPAQNNLNIFSRGNSTKRFEICLLDHCGKQIFSKTFTGQDTTLNLSDLQTGIYILKLKTCQTEKSSPVKW